jgi:hypothetical protein
MTTLGFTMSGVNSLADWSNPPLPFTLKAGSAHYQLGAGEWRIGQRCGRRRVHSALCAGQSHRRSRPALAVGECRLKRILQSRKCKCGSSQERSREYPFRGGLSANFTGFSMISISSFHDSTAVTTQPSLGSAHTFITAFGCHRRSLDVTQWHDGLLHATVSNFAATARTSLNARGSLSLGSIHSFDARESRS